jgi:hypothetical protein
VDVIVYRIERIVDRLGPWSSTGNASHYDACKHGDHSSCFEGPSPWEETDTPLEALWSTSNHRSDYHFGFTSPRQLTGWFTSAMGRRALAEKGYHVAIYEVSEPNVAKGNRQVAFIRPPRPIGSLDLVSLMPAGEC